MAVTMTEIQQLLDIEDLHYISDTQKNIICIPIQINGDQVTVFIYIMEDGEYILFRIPWFADASQAVNKEALYSKMLSLQNEFKLGRFVLDTDCKEIAFESYIAAEDGEVTLLQVRRHLAAIMQTVARYRQGIRHLAKEGVYTDIDGEEDTLRKLFEGFSLDSEEAESAYNGGDSEEDIDFRNGGIQIPLEKEPIGIAEILKKIWKSLWQ